jgi:type VI secretion system protein VasG
MLPELSIQLLNKQMAGEEITGIEVDVRDSAFVYEFLGGEAAAEALAVA